MSVVKTLCSFLKQSLPSIHTERAYSDWIIRFIKFHHLQERETLLIEPEKKVEDFLTHLAVQANVAASTQNQAFNALVLLYTRVLKQPLEGVEACTYTEGEKSSGGVNT